MREPNRLRLLYVSISRQNRVQMGLRQIDDRRLQSLQPIVGTGNCLSKVESLVQSDLVVAASA